MTTPGERTRAVLQTEQFLLNVARNRSRTPDVPDYLRAEAEWLLRHYPEPAHLQFAAYACSAFFGIPDGYDKYAETRTEEKLKPSWLRRVLFRYPVRVACFLFAVGVMVGILGMAAA